MPKKPTKTARLTIERDALLKALTATTKAIATRNTYTILANVLLSAKDGKLQVTGTDLDVEITTSAPCEGTLQPITAPARTLLEIAKKLSGETVTIEPDGDTLIVKAGRSRFVVATLSADGFPEFKTGDMPHSFTADLGAFMGRVSFAISNEETRYYLNGVYLSVVDDVLTAVATDGHRLGKITVPEPHDQPPLDFSGVIIPAKTVALFPLGEVDVSLSDTKIRFSYGDTVVVSKLIEGTFPDYERVIPKDGDKTAKFDRQALLAVTERVSIVSSERGGKAVKLETAADSIKLSVNGVENAAQEDLPCEYGGEPFAVGYNAGYLGDVLRAYAGDSVTVTWGADGAPALVTAEGDELVCVIMPMRINPA